MPNLVLMLALAPAFQEKPYLHEQPRFELVLPSEAWQPLDQSSAGVLVVVFTPVKDMSTRCSVLRFPGPLLPAGVETREQQVQEAAGRFYQRVVLEPGTLAGREARRWEYKIGDGTTIEWAFQDEDKGWVFFQLAAPAAIWGDPDERAPLERLPASFVWSGGADAAPASIDLSTPQTIRGLRALAAPEERPFEVTRHRIEALIEPEEHSFLLWDRIEVRARTADLREIELHTTLIEIETVTADQPLEWRIEKAPAADGLVVTLTKPLALGESVQLDVHAGCADFFQGTDQQLLSEIGVVGQVRPGSSWSSHVLWYPIDPTNDAEVDITLDVPAPLVALTGGKLVERVEADERVRYRYVEEQRRPRALPFGFAVGAYLSAEVVRASGLNLRVYGFPGEEKRVAQRIEVLTECADAFERALGPLPWSEVRFVHVKPTRKETGVSLPGLILVSDFYFPDLDGVDASSGNLSDPTVLGLLVVADEFSHQWNFYSAGFPNELAEGISTYTNALFLEVRHGAAAYNGTIRTCRDAWIGGAGAVTEFAISHPNVYSNARYRPVVFCKTPLVLDALRRRLGDQRFFDGFRRAFALRDPSVDGFERLERGFEAAAGEELGSFFEQWFFRAGFPTLRSSFEARDDGVTVTLRQTQGGEPYELDVEVELECADGSRHVMPVALKAAQQTFAWPLPARPVAVRLGPEGRLPARVEGP
ncbi:MAG: hypothetical protein HOP15_12685 [Planctomycetes bacterium]|nr:hypothetical protein [Planctomycetota bacterium]